jgi:carbonic anhydrase/acetyltransferase-like protein (isoleucine patch superfamily)
MAIYEFEGHKPKLGQGAYVHPSADVIGAVIIGDNCWIGPGARLRGDYGTIVIEDGTSIEDNCVIHARPNETTRIGKYVTIGHGCVIHNATIHDYAVIGMGSVVSDWAMVGEWAVVGEGAVVRQQQEIPAGGIAVGVPARLLDKQVGEEYKAEWSNFKRIYQDLARRYPQGMKEV